MISDMRILFLTIYMFIPLCLLGESINKENSVISDAVDDIIKRIASSPLPIPQLANAKMESVLHLSKKGPNERFECLLEAKNNRCGYLLLEKANMGYKVIAVSATCSDNVPNLMNNFESALPDAAAKDEQPTRSLFFVTNVPLIAVAKTRVGTEQVETKDLACCLSGLFNYLQYEKGIPLFGHVGFYGGTNYANKTITETNFNSEEMIKIHTKGRSFKEELSEEIRIKGIIPGVTSIEKAEVKTTVRGIASRIRRSRLLSQPSYSERYEMIIGEEHDICSVTPVDISRGARDSLLLQMDYLAPNSKELVNDLSSFFTTRGLTAKVKTSRVEDLGTDIAPAVLFADGKPSGLIIGSILLHEEDFLIVFFSCTGSPRLTPMIDKINSFKDVYKSKSSPSMSSEALSNLYAHFGQEISNAHARYESSINGMVLVEDIPSSSPEAFEKGVFIVRRNALRTWNVLYIGEIERE